MPPHRPRGCSIWIGLHTSATPLAEPSQTGCWRGRRHSVRACAWLRPFFSRCMVLCKSLVERPQALRTEPAPALAPILAPPVMGRWTERGREPCLPELAGKSLHRCFPAIVGVKGQHDTFHLWSQLCQPERSGSSANQGDHSPGRKASGQQCHAIKAAFDQHNLFGEVLWCVKAEPACRVGFDPAPGSAGPVEHGLVGVLVHAWFPLEQRAPDEPTPIRRAQREDDASDPALQEQLLLCWHWRTLPGRT